MGHPASRRQRAHRSRACRYMGAYQQASFAHPEHHSFSKAWCSMTALPNAESFVVEIEQDLLGSIMQSGELSRVSGIIRPDHFIEPIHALLYGYIQSASERYGSVKPVVVYKLIPEDDRRAIEARHEINLSAYLASLIAGCMSGGKFIERSARKVVEQWGRLKIGDEAKRLAEAANDPNSDPMTLINSCGRAFDDIASDVKAGPKRKTRIAFSEAAGNAFAAAEAARQRGSGLTGITWGLTDVNRLTGGIQRRDLTLIGARPSMGKTTLGLSVGISAARSKTGVGFISLEMDADKLAARGISDLAFNRGIAVPYADIIRGKVDDQILSSLDAATEDMRHLPLMIEDQSGLSITDIRIKTEIMMEQCQQAGNPLGALFIDHLGLIRASSRYSGNRVHEVTEMTGLLKGLAREYDIAVVLLSQLNRAVEGRDNKRPQLSDLRDSGSIEQDADTIIFLYREAYYMEREKGGSVEAQADRTSKLIDCQNKLEFIIAKQRNGPLATIDLFADMACAAVRNGVQR
ncbi:DnaB-like helicase C-terminal domain-containing protein [Mesorhizobium sp. BE184]|uniref:replicative DNA helicase n=1 Tax=Mesorhizobium sp. BE184 TaxID=2817714 RepID=UPI0028626C67|nr:DnaB-like helicase C-terminal domain-containing protein [Mesorhizobium sp. BE184]MDR7032414.1 replicative DNA helicase [Mesorhizobium sp. BE184]